MATRYFDPDEHWREMKQEDLDNRVAAWIKAGRPGEFKDFQIPIEILSMNNQPEGMPDIAINKPIPSPARGQEATEQPLSIEVKEGRLIISIGIGTLAFAAQMQPPFHAYDDKLGDWRNYWVIKDPLEFAKDVRNELGHEEEDGSTPLTELLDKVAGNALDQGCIGCEEVPTPEYEDEDDE